MKFLSCLSETEGEGSCPVMVVLMYTGRQKQLILIEQ